MARYYYRPGHPKASPNGFVAAEDMTDDVRPLTTVPVVTDRYMEGVQATDGTDIGSRAKRRAYMQAHGLADADDFKGVWAKSAEERAARQAGVLDSAERREVIGRTAYELERLNGRR